MLRVVVASPVELHTVCAHRSGDAFDGTRCTLNIVGAATRVRPAAPPVQTVPLRVTLYNDMGARVDDVSGCMRTATAEL